MSARETSRAPAPAPGCARVASTSARSPFEVTRMLMWPACDPRRTRELAREALLALHELDQARSASGHTHAAR